MKYDFLIRGGRVIDPENGVDAIRDIAVNNGKIIEYSQDNAEIGEVINAEGCFVTPGFIDFHSHLYYRHNAMGLNPDLALLPYGITSAVEAGSAGPDNWEGFERDVAYRSDVSIKSFVNIIPRGIMDSAPPDEVSVPENAYERTLFLMEKYPGRILGIKLWSKLGGKTLEDAVNLAEKLKCHLCVHASAPLRDMREILDLLRDGDILAHYTQGHRNTILDSNGVLVHEAIDARNRGVIFDVSHGRANYSLDIASSLLNQGFKPDVITSDVITGMTAFRPNTFGLLYVMTQYLAMGMSLYDVISRVTNVPARLMGSPELGSLSLGTTADITIFKLNEYDAEVKDAMGSKPKAGKGMPVPVLTLNNGRIAYRQMEYTFS